MATDGNGSGERNSQKFPIGERVTTGTIFDSILYSSSPGRDFIEECARRHSIGDWTETPTPILLNNLIELAAIYSGGEGHLEGVYKIPEWMARSTGHDSITLHTVITHSVILSGSREVRTLLMFTGEPLEWG